MKTMDGPERKAPAPGPPWDYSLISSATFCLFSTPLLYLRTDTEADGERGRLAVPGGVSPK